MALSTDASSEELQQRTTEVVPSEVVLEQWTLDLLDTIAADEGFVNHSIVHSSGSNIGDGFMGIMLRVQIRGERLGKEDEKSLMLKMPPLGKARQKQFNSAVLFERESYMYRDVLPKLVQFQLERGFTEDGPDGFFHFPKCYGIVCDPALGRFAIVLEDLKKRHYEMFNKFDVIDLPHVQLVLTELAKFHGVSIALRDQQPHDFEPLTQLKDVFVEYILKTNREMMENFQNLSFTRAMATLDDDEVELKAKIDQLRVGFIDIMDECVRHNAAGQAGVINHGDCWNNNLMYLYEKTSKTPQSICFIDFQISRVASPVLDLVYFLFTSTYQELRRQHMVDLLEAYYTTLSETVVKLGSDPNTVFSHAEFHRHLQRFGKFGVLVAPMLLHVITADTSELPDMDQLAEDQEKNGTVDPSLFISERTMQSYNKRVCDVFRDAEYFGYL